MKKPSRLWLGLLACVSVSSCSGANDGDGHVDGQVQGDSGPSMDAPPAPQDAQHADSDRPMDANGLDAVAADDSGDVDGAADDMSVPETDGSNVDPGDADVSDMDASAPDGSIMTLPDGGFLLPDGAVVSCIPATCQGRTYQCGDCIDNDGDSFADFRDPGCLNPCDNEELSYDLNIPGGDSAPCKLDCYYDSNQGSGNDGCQWDARCDPEVPDFDPACRYANPPPPQANCAATQSQMCVDFCLPITPNGCDCFGCCELPAGSGEFVFIGSVNNQGVATCRIEDVGTPSRCHPCTPVTDCMNDCGECELCLGRTTLPPQCFPPDAGPPVDAGPGPTDGGSGMDAGPYDGGRIDSGPPVDSGPRDGGTDAGPRDSGPLRCPVGVQPCGLSTDPQCPAGLYCLTGCCIYFG